MLFSACTPLRVMVVDDENLLRSGVAAILGAAPDLDVVAACGGAEAVGLAQARRAEVVLLDVRMPDVDGLTVLRRLRRLAEPPQVAMLTTFDADEYLDDALRAGAKGFLLKDTGPRELVSAVRALGTGGGCLSPPVVRRLLHGLLGSVGPATDLAGLSERERQVLALVAEGLSNPRIGERLHLSAATVKDHLSSVLIKLRVTTRVQAAVIATRGGLTVHRPGRGTAA
ncbi:response regulator [Kitasatospora sp. McL0602]|uniref:response regulator n=1 Tax=Kitasatospora sp. McL0602 TaxID=3439530 RepID=UPI003F893928